MSRILVKCMQGIGDQIYARPFVKLLAKSNDVYLDSVLPGLYSDIEGVKFLDPGLPSYRTQSKSYSSNTIKFSAQPKSFDSTIEYHYGRTELKRHGIVSHLEHAFGFDLGSDPIEFDLPEWKTEQATVDKFVKTSKKIAIIRTVTIRKEWLCSSRAPIPSYVNWCSRMLMDAGYHVISIADCVKDEEWILDEEDLVAHQYLHHGELGLFSTLALLKTAAVVVGGSGFIIPATVSAKTNLFVLFGGRGAYDNPHKVFDLRMNMKKIGWAVPDNFCRCDKMEHDCDKTIKNLDDRFFSFMGTI